MSITKRQVLLLVLGLALVAAPMATRADEDEDTYEEESEEEYDEEVGEANDEDVVVLTDANFESTVAKHKYVLVLIPARS